MRCRCRQRRIRPRGLDWTDVVVSDALEVLLQLLGSTGSARGCLVQHLAGAVPSLRPGQVRRQSGFRRASSASLSKPMLAFIVSQPIRLRSRCLESRGYHSQNLSWEPSFGREPLVYHHQGWDDVIQGIEHDSIVGRHRIAGWALFTAGHSFLMGCHAGAFSRTCSSP